MSIVLEGVPGEPFAAHRAILASRSPYFHALLLSDYADSNADTFTLPSPPFTPASTTFVLGYIYTGTLDFSPRKFDLATSFEIWRCAAFLSLSTLQSAIEYKVLGQLNPARAARVLAFAHAPDVNCARLANAARPLVVEHFDSAWTTTPHVGHLEYDVQKALVRGVCDRVKPRTAAEAASRVARARRQLEAERATWADHVRGMLDGVEEALLSVIAQSLPEVVASSGFVDLTEGVGFSTDVLEWLLTLVVKGLREGKAPRAYQALVGSVLLREVRPPLSAVPSARTQRLTARHLAARNHGRCASTSTRLHFPCAPQTADVPRAGSGTRRGRALGHPQLHQAQVGSHPQRRRLRRP